MTKAAGKKKAGLPPPKESAVQAAFFQNVALFAGPRLLIFAIPNERTDGAGMIARLISQGMLPGAADVIAIWAENHYSRVLFLEFKRPSKDSKQRVNQEGFQHRAESVRCGYVVVRSWQDAWHALEAHGAPVAFTLQTKPIERFIRRD